MLSTKETWLKMALNGRKGVRGVKRLLRFQITEGHAAQLSIDRGAELTKSRHLECSGEMKVVEMYV